MEARAVFGLHNLVSYVSLGILAGLFAWPWLRQTDRNKALAALVAPHAYLRFLGFTFLVPGVVSPLLPQAFAKPAAYGDLIAGILAIVAIIALEKRAAGAISAVWLFNVWGTADLLFAFYEGNRAHLDPGTLGAGYLLVTTVVPLLLVTHFLTFGVLARTEPASRRA